jgi:hypothetical protein
MGNKSANCTICILYGREIQIGVDRYFVLLPQYLRPSLTLLSNGEANKEEGQTPSYAKISVIQPIHAYLPRFQN